MDSTLDNSNGATLDNLNKEIFQKSSALTDGDLVMDIKNTNITSSIDTLNNIQSYTIDNQKSSEIIDQNRISNDDYIIDENNHTAPLNGKASEFIASDNYFGPESNVDDDTTTDSPVTDELIAKEDDIEDGVNTTKHFDKYFENIDFLKTVDEAEESDIKKEDVDVADHHASNFDIKENDKTSSADAPTDLAVESTKLVDEDLKEKIEDPVDDNIQPENVIVPESGEESEDEWNYIKVNRNANTNETQERNNTSHETVESQNTYPDLVNDNQTQDDEIVAIEESGLSEADMASQLNPDAKEFVPTSPSPTNLTPPNIADSSEIAPPMASLHLNLDDDLVSQSPRKGIDNAMVDVPVPEENDFLDDITRRPADLDSTVMSEVRPGSSSSQCSYQEMNLKEAMHGDEKSEYNPRLTAEEAFMIETCKQFLDAVDKQEQHNNIMNASFYNDGSNDSNNPFKVDLNAVHRLPTSDDENEDSRPIMVINSDGEEEELPKLVPTASYANGFLKHDNKEALIPPRSTPNIPTSVFQEELPGLIPTKEFLPLNLSLKTENGVNAKTTVKSIIGAVQEMVLDNMEVLGECNFVGGDVTTKPENVLSETVENVTSAKEVAAPIVSSDVVSFEVQNSETMPAVEQPIVESVLSNLTSELGSVPEVAPITVVESQCINEINNTVIEAETTESIGNNSTVEINDSSTEFNNSNTEIGDNATETNNSCTESGNITTEIDNSATVVEAENVVVKDAQPVLNEAAAIATVTAVTATAAVAAATKGKPTKTTEPKSKSASAAAKKPLSTVATAKPKPKPTDATSKVAPTPRPRTVASQPPVKAIDKKPATSIAAKKPANGEVKTTTTLSAAKRPISSATTAKPTTSARSVASTTTTTTRVTTSRLTTKTSTTSTTADAPKRITTTKTTTTTSSTLKPRPSSEKPTSTITKSPISKANTSATDKSTTDTANKLNVSGTRSAVSPRKVSATSKTGVVTKTAGAAKVPAVPAPNGMKRPVTSTIDKKVPATTANGKTVPTQKRPMTTSTNRSTTLETVKKTTSTIKKDTKSQANATKESKPKENGNGTNETHAFDMPIETNDAVNVEQPLIM